MNALATITNSAHQTGALPPDATPPDTTPHNDVANDPPPKPFPLHTLPPAAADMAQAIADVERVPQSLAGCCVLGVLSAAVGAGLQVKSGPERVTRGNLYLLPSAESGSGKSETFRHAVKPLQEFEARQLERWREHVFPGLQSERDMLEAEITTQQRFARKMLTGPERDSIRLKLEEKRAALLALEARLQEPVFTVEDVTTEQLAVLLSKRGECLASLSADAGAVINCLLGRYNKTERTDETLYLKAYTGDFYRADRVGRAAVMLQRPCLAVLWLVQPDKLDTLLGKRELTDGGLIPRLLLCHTQCQPRPIVEGGAGIPASVASDYAARVEQLLRTFRLAAEPVTVQPTPDALQVLNAHFNGIVKRRIADLRDVTTFAARWNEQAWRIAVCFHAGQHGADAAQRELDTATAEAAIVLADWFAAQQLDILDAGRQAAKCDTRDQILALLAKKGASVTARDVQRARIAPDASNAQLLLAEMEAAGILQKSNEKPKHGGHVTLAYSRKVKA